MLSILTSVVLAGDPCATVTDKQVPGGFDLVAELKNCTDVTFTVTLSDANNLAPETPLTIETPAKPGTKFTLVKFRAVNKKDRWSYGGWHQDWRIGKRLSDVPPSAKYQQPFAGKRKVLQKPHGSFSHFEGSMHEEAYDWAMPQGTKVLAARDGIVTGFRSDSDSGCADASCQYDCNYVVVRHDDGTYGYYAHLKPDGVLVTLGQRVSAGDNIALSGNTGWSSEPHLHFEVFNALDGKTQVTLPIEWSTEKPEKRNTNSDEVEP
ncbi:MAG: M23 family metallopeptidase [Archangium sp.]|nr:M23 family metallopeptidase [Archangium sp.]